MSSFALFFLPFALAAAPPATDPANSPAQFAPSDGSPETEMHPLSEMSTLHELVDGFRPETQAQVRIERRVIIRIAPRSPSLPPDTLAALPQESFEPRYVERKIGKCLPVKAIVGVQAERDNRLLLFLRDRRVIAASLEKSCRARDFYSGFYLEHTDDGMLCSGRDKLQSRAGANCALEKIRQVVSADR